jgi:RNA methyltransferase, TrmH family
MQHVTSRHNPRLKEAARLIASSRDRRKAGKCVLEGEHLVAVYVERHGAPESMVVSEDALLRPAVRALAERHPDKVLVVPAKLFGEIAALPSGVAVLAVVRTPRPTDADSGADCGADRGDFCLLLEDVQDPGNVGSILRTAAAAGVERVLMSAHCAFAWSPKVLRAGQGAHFYVAIHEDVDLVAWALSFRAAGGDVVAMIAEGGESLFSETLSLRIALAIGNEGAGISSALEQAASRRLTIPMPGGVESLNAAAAAAVCLFECVRQRGANR